MEVDMGLFSLTLPTNDEDDVYGDASTTTTPVISSVERNVTTRRLCSVGEDVSQRISVVSIIMVCTIVGNLTLILTLTLKRSRRIKRVNVFLVNLAIGDLAVAVFMNTTEILFLAFGDWALGPAACKISVYMQIVTLASATFLLTAMSMDRYQVIVKPMQSLARRPRIWMKVGVAWVMAFIFATPQLFIFLQLTDPVDGRRCCVSRGYTHEWQRKAYMSFLTAYILLIPTFVMIYCYANIIHVVWIRASADEPRLDIPQLPGSVNCGISSDDGIPGSPRMSVRRGLVTSSKRRVVIMTLTVIVGFLVCQTPYFLVSLIRIYSNYRIKLPAFLAVSENIVLMHSALNPVLYGLFTLRKAHFVAILDCLTCKGTPSAPGERHRLLNGKWLGRTLKSNALQKSERSTDTSEDLFSQNDSQVCKNSAVCTEDKVCKKRTVCINTDRNLHSRRKGREKDDWRENSTGVPLLFIANTAAVNASDIETNDVSAKEENSAVKWGKGPAHAHPNQPTQSPSKDRPNVACSQWTPVNVTSNSECYSCV